MKPKSKPKSKTVQCLIRLTEEVAEQMRIRAEANHRSLTAEVSVACEQYVARLGKA
jgi:hypothetical protein